MKRTLRTVTTSFSTSPKENEKITKVALMLDKSKSAYMRILVMRDVERQLKKLEKDQ